MKSNVQKVHKPFIKNKRTTRILIVFCIVCGVFILWFFPIHHNVHKATSFAVAGGLLFVFAKAEMEEEKIRKVYHFARLGRLTSNVMHDLSQPATNLLININRLEEALDQYEHKDNDIKESLRIASNNVKIIKEYIHSVRNQIMEQQPGYLFQPVCTTKEVLLMYMYRIRKQKIKLHTSFQNNIRLFGDPIGFMHVLSNLLSNSIDSFNQISGERSKDIFITLRNSRFAVILEVEDTGCGIPRKNLRKIFDTFFTTKKVECGCGLGLAYIKEIVEKEYKGKISVVSQLNVGTKFTVSFPL